MAENLRFQKHAALAIFQDRERLLTQCCLRVQSRLPAGRSPGQVILALDDVPMEWRQQYTLLQPLIRQGVQQASQVFDGSTPEGRQQRKTGGEPTEADKHPLMCELYAFTQRIFDLTKQGKLREGQALQMPFCSLTMFAAALGRRKCLEVLLHFEQT
ncbi:MAG: hypothetical protein MHM6MM_006525, partial [Cercozoa sp. M6MM]